MSTRQLLRTVAMGQGLAAVICGTAITSQYLATDFHVNTPMFQSFLAYALLCLTYTTMLVFKRGRLTRNQLHFVCLCTSVEGLCVCNGVVTALQT